MHNLQVFISHSAQDDDARAVLDTLYRQLMAADFDVLVDRERLLAGKEWRIELFSWLKRCHGAIILFSADALNSSWVLQEATILNWRRFYEQEFVIIPVYLPPVTPSDLDADWFAALDLGRFQGIKGSLIDGVDGIVDKVVMRLQEVYPGLQATQQLHENWVRRTPADLAQSSDQVAAICYKRIGHQLRYLLIRTSSRKRWIVPKGWTQADEPAWLTAQLEARQEAGVAGDVDRHFSVQFQFWKTTKRALLATAFPLEVVSEFEPDETYRHPSWYTLEEAQERLRSNRKSGRHLNNAQALHNALEQVHKRLLARGEGSEYGK